MRWLSAITQLFGIDLSSVPAYLGGGSLLYAVYLLIKARSESGAVVVKSAEGVVVLQSNVIKELREENRELQRKIDLLEKQVDSLERQLRKATRLIEEHGLHLEQLDKGKRNKDDSK